MTLDLLERELEVGKNWYKGVDKNLDEAALQFRRVVQMARLSPFDRLIEARALGNYATVLKDLHKCDDASLCYRLCCRILHALGEKQLVSECLKGGRELVCPSDVIATEL